MPVNEEIWKPVVGYEGFYEVSNMGNVRNRQGKQINQYDNHYGYMQVGLWDRKIHKTKHIKTHRLVATAFIDNPENKRTVNHIDGNKHNNRVDNLEWATQSENLKHAMKTGLKPYTQRQRESSRKNMEKNARNHVRRVISIASDGTETLYDSVKEASKAVGRVSSAIVRCCRGLSHSCADMKWRYVDECRLQRKR